MLYRVNFQILNCRSNMYKELKFALVKVVSWSSFILLLCCSYFFKGCMLHFGYKLYSSAKSE